jgi:heme A synthase
VLVHLGWAAVVIAAIRLIKYAIDNKDRWWRLAILIVVLAAVAVGALWVLGRSGLQRDHHVGASPHAVASAAGTHGVGESGRVAGLNSPPAAPPPDAPPSAIGDTPTYVENR